MKYIPSIDGLRAIAVIGVLLFHFEYKFIPGGFVGVDVFFVISGYLISKIISSELRLNTFSIAKFYNRRLRRILPGLATTLIATIIIFTIISTPSETQPNQDSLLAAILSVSNIYFSHTTDYFHNNTNNPYLHTWSLAVEEQFYLFFPLLLILISKKIEKRKYTILIAFGVISFGLSIIYTLIDRQTAFYLPQFRAWELMVGSALAYLRPDFISREIRKASSYIGLVMVIGSFHMINENMIFPGALAIIPVVGAGLMIFGANENSLLNQVLASRVPVFLGKISYSLYLIHWPVWCGLVLLGIPTKGIYGLIAIASCTLLAWMNYRFVETPFRHNKDSTNTRVFAFSAIALISIALLGHLSVQLNSVVWSKSPRAIALAKAQDDPRQHFGESECFLTSKNDDFRLFNKDKCLSTESTKKKILLMGDSHSAHFFDSIQKIFPDRAILQASASGCIPIINTTGTTRCVDLFSFVFNDFIPNHARDLEAVILSSRWRKEDIKDIELIDEKLNSLGIKLVVLGPSHEYKVPLPRILAFEDIYQFELSNKSLVKSTLETDATLKNDLPANIRYFSTQSNLCKDGNCISLINDVPTIFDKDHFTAIGADTALVGLGRCLDESPSFCAR